MSIELRQRSPLGAPFRSPLGVLGSGGVKPVCFQGEVTSVSEQPQIKNWGYRLADCDLQQEGPEGASLYRISTINEFPFPEFPPWSVLRTWYFTGLVSGYVWRPIEWMPVAELICTQNPGQTSEQQIYAENPPAFVSPEGYSYFGETIEYFTRTTHGQIDYNRLYGNDPAARALGFTQGEKVWICDKQLLYTGVVDAVLQINYPGGGRRHWTGNHPTDPNCGVLRAADRVGAPTSVAWGYNITIADTVGLGARVPYSEWSQWTIEGATSGAKLALGVVFPDERCNLVDQFTVAWSAATWDDPIVGDTSPDASVKAVSFSPDTQFQITGYENLGFLQGESVRVLA